MPHLNRFASLLLAGLFVGVAFIGCSDDDDDDNDNGNTITGIWQYTDTGVEQETVEILANGTFTIVLADYDLEECMEVDGTWTVDDDSLHSTINGIASTVAWSRSGSTLSITEDDGTVTAYSSVASLPSCDDYGFGGGGGLWSGTITASVAGTPTDFSTFIYGDIESGVLGFGGNGGTRQIQFTLLGTGPGTYALGAGSMGIYVPDTSNPTVVMTTMAGVAPGTVTLTTATATRIIGSFSFTAMNFQTTETVQITAGTIDITAN